MAGNSQHTEKALAKRHLIQKASQTERKQLIPLKVKDSLQVQNQNGNRPTK